MSSYVRHYVQLRWKHCSKYQLVDIEHRYDPYTCEHCNTLVHPDVAASSGAPGIISDRTRVNGKLSSEFRTGVLDKIMSVNGANNASRKYG